MAKKGPKKSSNAIAGPGSLGWRSAKIKGPSAFPERTGKLISQWSRSSDEGITPVGKLAPKVVPKVAKAASAVKSVPKSIWQKFPRKGKVALLGLGAYALLRKRKKQQPQQLSNDLEDI